MTNCGNPNPRYATRFAPGAAVWGVAYVRDMRRGSRLVLAFVRPDGRLYRRWVTAPAADTYSHTWWWGMASLPAAGANGTWKVRVNFDGRVSEQAFVVGAIPASTVLSMSTSPLARRLAPNATANFDVTVRNRGLRNAVGCTVVPDVPLAAVWNVRQIAPLAPANALNRAFDLARNQTKRFRLMIKPKRGYKADAIVVPIRVACLNANSPVYARTNVVTLTF
jgi:hypothetical protein